MKRPTILILFLFLAAAMVCFGQNAQNLRWCDPTGTWYGGSDLSTPYKLVVQPIGISGYSMNFQLALDYSTAGLLN